MSGSMSPAVPRLHPVSNLRGWLLRRIELEAKALANAEPTTRDVRRGRLLGLIEVGVSFG
jgi:hypothetical protein